MGGLSTRSTTRGREEPTLLVAEAKLPYSTDLLSRDPLRCGDIERWKRSRFMGSQCQIFAVGVRDFLARKSSNKRGEGRLSNEDEGW